MGGGVGGGGVVYYGIYAGYELCYGISVIYVYFLGTRKFMFFYDWVHGLDFIYLDLFSIYNSV